MRKKGATESMGGTITKEDVVLGKVLGKGACGMVYEARLKSTNMLVAMKTINVYDKERRH
jgi:serine/threonine protein kinase